MFFWGTKQRQKKLGIVAEFCPFCREIQPFKLFSIDTVNHVYLVSLGPGKVTGFIGVCEECGMERSVDAMIYHKKCNQSPDDLQELIQTSNPKIYETHSKRFELEKRLKNNDPITREERDQLLFEPFDIVAPMLERRYGESTKFDKKSGRSCLITLLIPLVFSCISVFFINQNIKDILKIISAFFVLVGIIITAIYIFSTHRRYLKQTIYPVLAKAIKPLDPSVEELDMILKKYRSLGFQVGKRIDAQILYELINEEITT